MHNASLNQTGSTERLLINKRELSTHLGLTPRTIEIWARAGKIPHYKIGRSVRYRLADVLEHIERAYKVGGAV
ncbi:MAG: helix-turn-helix domain-containing protein [Verrucomicrobia bacterium]|nr:helix-turn-helix domain-containing protein [Verrucomicrobiota bacterium]